ncbi:hypothetical protein [Polaribacter sp. Asnod1-A03]|uniref:hypothetical protein n=1 Tax=Polaribacter sp. Asnod1-A03 TaxID=3160581 RepID=UPI00386D2BD9
MNIRVPFFVLLNLILIFSCDDNNVIVTKSESVIINAEIYQETTTNNYTIKDISMSEDILTVIIESSGCDGETWETTLIDSSAILESNPIQRNIKILLNN